MEKFKEVFIMIFGASIIYLCVYYFFVISFNLFPNIDVEGVRQVLPIFNTTFSLLIGYYWGSSASNKIKDATINALTIPTPNASTQRTELTVTKTEPDK